MTDLRYPIGPFRYPAFSSQAERSAWIDQIATLPEQVRLAAQGLSDDQLDTRYRPDGWTLRQVIHHIPDSHINAYVRFKLALTEAEPTIRPYDEVAWAELPDSREAISQSLVLLDAVHGRWTELLRSLSESDWRRRYLHPDSGPTELNRALAMYAWHGRHHLAHITETVTRNGWS